MLFRLGLILEILALVVCIQYFFDKKVRVDFATGLISLSILIVLLVINEYNINNIYTAVVYLLLFVYCLYEFGKTIVTTIITEILFLIVFSALQFICMFCAQIIVVENEEVRNILGDIFVLFICICCLPKWKLDKMTKNFKSKKPLVIASLTFITFIIILLLVQNKIYKEINIGLFVFAMPAVLLLIQLISSWNIEQNKVVLMEQEVLETRTQQEKYQDLLINVRMRQHEFKNHIAAILSTHYAYHTYEQLVEAQKEYCGKVEKENRYNNLLTLGDSFVCGFLFGKFQDIESRGITITYKVNSKLEKYDLPVNYLIEMLGILLDNAAEALEKTEDVNSRKMDISIEQEKQYYRFIIANPFSYVTYEEMEKWFNQGMSTKGNRRGLGLFHLKQLCDEWDCRIISCNKKRKDTNWIEMILEIK